MKKKYNPHLKQKPTKSVWDEQIKVKADMFGGQGKVKPLLFFGSAALIGSLVGLGLSKIIKDIYNRKKLDSETSAGIMKYITEREADARLTERKRAAYEKNRNDDFSDSDEDSDDNQYVNELDCCTWEESFHSNFKNLCLEYPDVLFHFLCNAPDGYEEPIIAVLTAGLASCFSKVEALYLDDKYHRANLLVCVEGEYGSGKGNYKTMYDTLFGRRIHRDAPKLACERGDNKIIQTVSVSATSSRLTDIIANNRGVHCVAFEPEVKTFYQAIKKSNGLGFDLLRKAFDNDEIYRINKDTSSPQGLFPVALNLIMTGTPGDTRDFIQKELEGGTISRFCWCVMPKPKKDTKAFPMPQGKVLSDLQNQIDVWTEQYSYKTDEDGNDIPADPFRIDLGYVNDALKAWLGEQWDKGEEQSDSTRQEVRLRIGAIAFNSAIVYHMLYGNPTPREHGKRETIVNLTLYMADYYMERYLHKFSKIQNEQRAQNRAADMVLKHDAPTKPEAVPVNPNWKSDVPEATVKAWYERFQSGDGYGKIATAARRSKDKVRSQIHIYSRMYNLPLRTVKAD